MNSLEKYFARAAGLEKVLPGQDIRCAVDLVAAHDVTGPMAFKQFEKIGIEHVFDPDKVVMVMDHIYPASTVQARGMHRMLKAYSKKFGAVVYDRGQGVIHQLLSEKFNLKAGAILLGADSHTCTAGGYGVVGIGVGSTELAAAMATGTTDLEVPEVVQVYLTGKLSAAVEAKDVVLTLLARFHTDGLTDRALLLTGPGSASLTRDERMTICNMGIEMGAMTTCFAGETKETDVQETVVLDLKKIEPMAACPFSPGNVKKISELQGLKISQVVVGSCTNGRLSDMETVAGILAGQDVHPDVNMLVIPASQDILEAMESKGYCRIIRKAGAAILNPGCGPCFGAHQGLATKEDIVVSTTNRNFPGRMGDPKAQIYLTSPITAVTAAVSGELKDPRA